MFIVDTRDSSLVTGLREAKLTLVIARGMSYTRVRKVPWSGRYQAGLLQALCIDVRIEPMPTSITKCRKVNKYNSGILRHVYTDPGS